MMRLSIGALLKVMLAALTIAAMVGCGGGGGGGSSVPKPTIKFLNASPDSTALTFLMNDDVRASGLAYLESSPTFVTIDPNDYDMFVREDGSPEDLDAITATLGADKDFVATAIGLENFGTENLKRIRIVPIEVDMTAPNGSKARLYILHTFNRQVGFDTPAIDFQSPGDNPQYKVTGINFAGAATLTVDSGSQTFEARRAGTENVYATATQALDAGGIYIVLFTGIEGQVGTQAPQLVFVKLN
jgi:hypothetical protein